VTSPCGAVHSIFTTSGKWIETNHAKDLYQTVWDILDEGYQYSAANSQSIPSSARMIDFFGEKVAAGKYDSKCQERLLQIVEMWGTFMAAECENQSLKFFWLEQGIDGGECFWIQEPILSCLMKPHRQSVRCEHLQEHYRPSCAAGNERWNNPTDF
jgi:hypothetical protein